MQAHAQAILGDTLATHAARSVTTGTLVQAPTSDTHKIETPEGWTPGFDVIVPPPTLMLKSLHHVPMSLMDRALDEVARVLRPVGWLYASEPVYAGPLNEIVRLYNDEGEVRAAAQAALDRAVTSGAWQQAAERHFDMPARYASFEDFEQRSMRPTFADHHLTEGKVAQVRERFLPHLTADGARFMRPMHVRLLRKAS